MPRTRSVILKAVSAFSIPNFQCFTTSDNFGRIITFYLSQAQTPVPLPIAAYVQGSGCHSVFRVGRGGHVHGGYQNILYSIARTRARVLVVEKPGVECFDNPRTAGVARKCSDEFLEEHTLPRWAEAVNACLKAARTLADVNKKRMLVVGHSEGGLVAARIAAENKDVSHVALLSSTGPTQLFDLAVRARTLSKDASRADARVRKLFRTFEQIKRNPDSVSNFAWGHPYRRWSSFLATSTIDELLRTAARIYIAHGARDRIVPIAAFEMLRAELIRHERDVVARRVENVGHNFCTRREKSPAGIAKIFSDMMKWFLNEDKAS